jgi:hypothetical protein
LTGSNTSELITAALPFVDGIDKAGIFGPPGASLVGDAFTVNWTGNVDCSPDFCTGGSFYGTPNPVDDVVLTINGHSYAFGNGVYGVFGPQAQNVTAQGNAIDTGYYYNGGEFFINNGNGLPTTSGRFADETVIFNGMTVTGVPAPIVGTGLPALVLITVVLIRKELHLACKSSSATFPIPSTISVSASSRSDHD